MAGEKVLGKCLGSFQLGRRRGRSEAGEFQRGKVIDNTGDQGGLGPNNRQIEIFVLNELCKCRDVIRRNVYVTNLVFVRGTGIARGDDDFGDVGGLGALPGESVLATAGTNDQDFHRVDLFGRLWRPASLRGLGAAPTVV